MSGWFQRRDCQRLELETKVFEEEKEEEMIPSDDYLEQKQIYSKDGKGLWRVIAYCAQPTLTMENVITKQRETFGLGGATALTFNPIAGLKVGDLS